MREGGCALTQRSATDPGKKKDFDEGDPHTCTGFADVFEKADIHPAMQ